MSNNIGNRPLLISDCDEVLLHMVVPFRDWLDEDRDISFDLESGSFIDALRHKETGKVVKGDAVWGLLQGFFDTEMYRQEPIDGALNALERLSQIADIVILTNLTDDRMEARSEQLRKFGIDVPVYTNQGGKGEAMKRILEEYNPSAAVFVDDLGHQHDSIADITPDVWRLHLVGEPVISKFIKTSKNAHHRIDNWEQAEEWVREKLLSNKAAPKIDM